MCSKVYDFISRSSLKVWKNSVENPSGPAYFFSKPFDYHFNFLDSDWSIQVFQIILIQPCEIVGVQNFIHFFQVILCGIKIFKAITNYLLHFWIIYSNIAFSFLILFIKCFSLPFLWVLLEFYQFFYFSKKTDFAFIDYFLLFSRYLVY